MSRTRKSQVYSLLEAAGNIEAVVRYSGDPDEYAALAHAWLMDQDLWRWRWDATVAVEPPVYEMFRMNPCGWSDEYGWTLGRPTKPGRGVWWGSYLRLTQIGCTICTQLGGRHAPACLNEGIVGLVTLQFQGDQKVLGPFRSEEIIHAVRVQGAIPGVRRSGTPGPTLCGLQRFAPETPTWTLGGGTISRNVTYRGCYQCGQVALREFPGVTISGTREFAEAFGRYCGVPLAPHLNRDAAAERPATQMMRV